MRFLYCLVGEINPSAGEAQVVQRELQRLAGRLVGGRAQAFQDVVNVKAPAAQVHQRQHRLVDLNRVGHRGQAQQRLHFRIYIDALDADLGHAWGRRGQFGDGQVTDGEFERPRLEVDGAYGDGPAQLFRRNFLRLGFEQRRHHQPAQRPEHQQRGKQPGGTP